MIIENPLFKEKSSDSVSITEYSLLADDQHRGLIEEPRQHFHKLLAKPWPFRFLKGLHWLLLLLITVLCVVGNADYNFTLRWSSCWNNALNGFLEKLNNNQNALVQITIVPLLMATGSLAVQRWKGKTQLPSIALADFSLGCAFILVQLLLIFYYGLRSYIEYSCFYPKLRDPSTSLAELTEWGKNSYRREPWYDGRYRPSWRTTTEPPSTTISSGDLERMEQRKLFIMGRLVLDPTITILALVAVLLQAGLLLSISRAIKRSRVWATNYRLEHPNCTEQEAKYAKFWPLGLTKLAQVVIPMAYLVFGLPLSERLSLTNVAIYASLAFACLINRLRYIKRVRFCKGYFSKTQAEETEQLANFRRMDCFFNICGFFLFGIQRIFVVNYYRESALKLYVDCAILFLFLIASLYIYSLQPGAGKLGNIRKALRIPRICINVEFNVKKDDGEEEKTKKEKKDDVEDGNVSAGQMPKAEEETAENQIQQKTCPAPAEI